MVSQHPFPSHDTQPPFWGHPTMCRNLDELLAHGVQVDLVCTTPRLCAGRRLPGWPGLRIYGFPMWQRRSPAIWYPLQYLAFFAWALFVVSGLALRRRYDVVQVDNIPDLLVFSTLVPRLRRMPIVFFMYELMPEMTATRLSLGASDRGLRLVYLLERAATRWADRIITVSDRLRRILAGRGVDPARVSVVANSFAIGDLPPRVEPNRPVLILPSTLIERNGGQVAIRAVAELVRDWPDLTLRILGGGEYRATLIALTNQLGLQKHVSFSDGFVPRSEAVREIRRSTLGLVPLLPDGYGQLMLPNKVFEFVFMDIPFVCSRLPAIEEHLPGDAVAYFEPGDVASLAGQIRRLLRDPQAARQQAARARRAMAELSWAHGSRRYLDALGVAAVADHQLERVSLTIRAAAGASVNAAPVDADLFKANTPAAFWRLLEEPSEDQWAAAIRLAVAELPEAARSTDIDQVLAQTLGEGQFGPDHWGLPWSLQLYYLIKPALPRLLTVALRKLRRQVLRTDRYLGWPVEAGYARFQWAVVRHLLRMTGRTELSYIDFWPDGHRYAFVLTHDIERAAGQARVRELADIDASYGFRSSFNFVPEGYRLDLDLIEELRQRGFEVGVHGLKHDGRLFRSREEFNRQVGRINAHIKALKAAGFRAPSTHRHPEWMQALDIEYDLSFFDTDPHEPIPGGTMSLWPFEIGRICELPYTLTQDYTLTAGLGETTPRVWLKKVDFIEQQRGMALVNTHPDYLTDRTTRRVYTDFLEAIRERSGYWNALPVSVARWWRARRQAPSVASLPGAVAGTVSLAETATGIAPVQFPQRSATYSIGLASSR